MFDNFETADLQTQIMFNKCYDEGSLGNLFGI